jgi:hypothetical protein
MVINHNRAGPIAPHLLRTVLSSDKNQSKISKTEFTLTFLAPETAKIILLPITPPFFQSAFH